MSGVFCEQKTPTPIPQSGIGENSRARLSVGIDEKDDAMKMPKKIVKSAIITGMIVLFLVLTLVFIFGFDKVCQIIGFISAIVGLPTALVNLFGIIYILDEEKLITKTLLEAGKRDRETWEAMKSELSNPLVQRNKGGRT